MKLEVGKTYKYCDDPSRLRVTILDIGYEEEGHVQALISLTIKGFLQEQPKFYKLYFKNISHWEEVNICE